MLFILIIVLILLTVNLYFQIIFYSNSKKNIFGFDVREKYIQKFEYKENRFFPFRYFKDENDKILPFVAVTAFFRDDKSKNLFYEYKKMA
jgi:hypothetical protein